MSDIDRNARSENSEGAGIIKACGVCGTVLDLKAETENVSTHVREETRRVIYLGAVKDGREPTALVRWKLFSGKGSKAPRGSSRSLRVSSPVLVIVVMTFNFSKPSTLTLGVDDLMVKLGVAKAATAEATRAAWMEGGNIVMQAVDAAEKTQA